MLLVKRSLFNLRDSSRGTKWAVFGTDNPRFFLFRTFDPTETHLTGPRL